MSDTNKVIMIGRLVRDPETKTVKETTLCNFTIACGRKYKQQEETVFIDCQAWGKLGDVINQYCAKGKQVAITGRLKQDNWEDKNGGGKRSKISIVVEDLQMLGGKSDSSPPPQSFDDMGTETDEETPF